MITIVRPCAANEARLVEHRRGIGAHGREVARRGEDLEQIVVGNEGDRYNQYYKKIMRELEKGKPLHEALHVAETTLGEVAHDTLKSIFMPKSQEEKEREMRRGADLIEAGRK